MKKSYMVTCNQAFVSLSCCNASFSWSRDSFGYNKKQSVDGWDNLHCSVCVFLAVTSKVKKELEVWNSDLRFPSGIVLVSCWYRLHGVSSWQASLECVCQAPGCWMLLTLAMNKCVLMTTIHWLQNTWLLREKLCWNYPWFLQVLLLGIDGLIELLIY